jgi:hypothetical protein
MQKVQASNFPAASIVDRIQRLIRVLERFEQEEQGER